MNGGGIHERNICLESTDRAVRSSTLLEGATHNENRQNTLRAFYYDNVAYYMHNVKNYTCSMYVKKCIRIRLVCITGWFVYIAALKMPFSYIIELKTSFSPTIFLKLNTLSFTVWTRRNSYSSHFEGVSEMWMQICEMNGGTIFMN